MAVPAAQVGVMVNLSAEDFGAKIVTSRNLARVLRAAAAQIEEQRDADGDYTHTATGISFQIRSKNLA